MKKLLFVLQLFLFVAFNFFLLMAGYQFTTSSSTVYTPAQGDPQFTSKEDFDPSLLRLNSMEKITAYSDSLYQEKSFSGVNANFAETYPEVVSSVIRSRFFHGYSEYGLNNNYMAKILSSMSIQGLNAVVIPDDILKYPYAACSQQSIVFMNILQQKGFLTRKVGFQGKKYGHFCFEVFYDGNWHFYDPDMEPSVAVLSAYNRPGIDFLERHPDILLKAYHQYPADKIMDIFSHYSYGAVNTFAAPNAMIFQKVAKFFSYTIWIFFLLAFIFTRKKYLRLSQQYYVRNNRIHFPRVQPGTSSVYYPNYQHRGPDAEGLYYDETGPFHIGLGHRRLSIIDLSNASAQPMYSHCGRYVMIYNGELYNYNEVREDKMPGFSWKSSGDTEVILECYARYGGECFQWFNGMFALAIWDMQDKKLILARDHIGIKPMYVYVQSDTLIFASELKAIRKAVPALKINYSAIPSFLHLGYIVHPHTIYQEVKKLDAGSYAIVSANAKNNLSLSEHSFWKIQDKITNNGLSNESEAKKQLNELLSDAVQKQLISDVPIGTFLSGGTDSSLVTALATKVSVPKVKTFSIAVTDGKVNEAPYAAAVAKHLNTEHYELPITQQEMLEMVPGFLDVYDEPFSDSSAFPTMLVSKLARKYVTVTLSGDGGDELFGGYNSYLWAKRLQNPLLKAGAPLIYTASKFLDSRYKRAGLLFQAYPNGHFNSHVFSQDQYFFSEKELNNLLIQPTFNFDAFNYTFTGRKLDAFEQISFWDIENYLKDDLLVKVDRASMKYSLETRVPLLDYRLVEFALNLSPDLKINKEGTMKYLLKEVLYDYVPKPLLDRPKWGFSIPLVKWLKTDLKWLVDKYCSREIIEQAGVVKHSEVNKLVKLYQAGKDDHLYNRIWSIIVLHWFLHEYN